MKRTRILGLLVAAALLLGLVGIVSAQEPEFFTSFSPSPSSPFVGDTSRFTAEAYFGGETDSGGLSCLEVIVPNTWTVGPVKAGSGTLNGNLGTRTGWATLYGNGVFTTTQPVAVGTGCDTANYTAYGSGSTVSYFIEISGTISAFTDGSITFDIGDFTAAEVGADQTVTIAYDDSPFQAGTTIPKHTTITVNAAATTRYVANNSFQCLGNTPCNTGPTGLQDAIDALNTASSTVVILGQYETSSGTAVDVDNGQDIVIKGQGGASLLSASGACSNYMLNLNNGGNAVTIQDLTLDGDANCTSGSRNGINIGAGTGIITIQDLTICDMGTGVAGTADFTNDGVTYDNNTTGVSVSGGMSTFDDDTFTDNTTGAAVSGGTITVTNSIFDGNTTGVNHTAGGTANIGTAPGNGNTFTDNTVGILSAGGTIKDNTISGGTTGISLTATSSNVYANTVSGASGNQIECGGSFAGAGYNYIGGNYGGGGTNCTDSTDQLGSEIVAWTDGTSLNECSLTSGSGPIFDLGNDSPYGLTPPQGRDSKYYATTSLAGTVTTTVGTTQFKMNMDRMNDADTLDVCNPMTAECWESAPDRAQTGDGYYFGGSQDPTALTLANVTAESPNLWLPVAMAVVVLAGVGGALLLLRRRRTM